MVTRTKAIQFRLSLFMTLFSWLRVGLLTRRLRPAGGPVAAEAYQRRFNIVKANAGQGRELVPALAHEHIVTAAASMKGRPNSPGSLA